MQTSQKFRVKFANSGALLERAQILRQRVFFSKAGKDNDSYDKYCDHIIVVETDSQQAVGTYRLLLGSVARKHMGFYSETEFDLHNIKNNCKEEVLELGRACVDPAYRRYPILPLMWGKIISFIEKRNIGYVFGCASIDKPLPGKVGKIFSFFKENCLSSPDFRVYPLKGKAYPFDKSTVLTTEKEIFRLLPSLIKGYLKMGAVVCGEPVWDKIFNTADFFMMLETKKINPSYKSRFI